MCASFFYFRIKKKEWRARAKLIAGLGYNCVDVYFPWNYHETAPGEFDFSGERDLDCFLSICEENNLYVMARPGPYICSEWDGGGLPAWVLCDPGVRQNEPAYLRQVERWYSRILPLLAHHQHSGRGGGCIILLQLENELDFFDCKDVGGYVERLRDMALSHRITVPLFTCAGQGDIKRSGGLTGGVLPAYNFYPSFTDPAFDHALARYAEYLQKKGAAFLVSETSKSHHILKRELLAGAKLLGAYNQVGGTNFGYSQSVNNWGDPLSLISTLYELDGMIDNLGRCTPEADEALLFSEMLRIYGTALAKAAFCKMEPPFPSADETLCATNALALADGNGFLLCARSVRETPAVLHSRLGRQEFELSLAAGEAVALPYQLKTGGCTIVFSNNEIFSLKPLVFIERSKPFLLLEKGGKQILVTQSGCYEGIEVSFIPKEEAITRIKAGRGLTLTYAKALAPRPVTKCLAGRFVNRGEFAKAESSLFSANQIWYGQVEYCILNPQGETGDLFFQGVADFLTVHCGGETVFSRLCAGGDVILPGSGQVRALVEQWGHSNFDDARRRSLRIASPRGVEKIFRIRSRQELNRWSFTEVDSFSPTVKIEPCETDPHISINHWNSTHKPLFAAYYTEIVPQAQPGEELVLVLEGMEAECNLFINGSFVARFSESRSSINVTGFLGPGRKNLIALCVRKRNWAVQTGRLWLLRVIPCEFELRRVDHRQVYSTPLEPARLPLRLEQGKQYALCLETPLERDAYGLAGGSGYRATVLQAGEVIARIVAKSEKIAQAGSHNSSQFLIPGVLGPDRKLYFFLEAMEDGCFEFAIDEGVYEND